MQGQLIIIEGLIGVGKTVLAEKLSSALNYKMMKEPVEENPYLEKFYDNPKRYALEMQFWLMSRRFAMHREAVEHLWSTGQGVVMDRSIYGDAVFAKKNHLDGNIDVMGYQNYMNMRNAMFRYLLVPHLTLYLEASVDICLKRINSRSRDCEQTIPEDYLAGLEKLYNELMIELKERGSIVAKLNWNKFPSFEKLLLQLQEKGLVTINKESIYPRIRTDQSFFSNEKISDSSLQQSPNKTYH